MHQDLVEKISNRESRIQDAVEFFGWPRELVECMMKNSLSYFEGVWGRYYPDMVDYYYAAGYYIVRQLSYTKDQIFTDDVCKILDQVSGSCLDFACGVGDYAMYISMNYGYDVFVVEHPGLPARFADFRFRKHGLKIPVYLAAGSVPDVDHALLISALDHVHCPVDFIKNLSRHVRKKIFATPCIDETYDRPTHIKSILADVPKAFEVIRDHNARAEKI